MDSRCSCLVLFFGALAAAGAFGFTPSWEKGQSWTVSTIYRRLPEGGEEPGKPFKAEWSVPTSWVFSVARTEARTDGRYFLVQVKDGENSKTPAASLLFASYELPGGQRALALIRGRFNRVIRGRTASASELENEAGRTPRPVLHEMGGVPYDFPSFPILEPAQPARKRTFELTQDMGGMKFAKDIVQSESTGLDPHEWAGDELEKRSGYKATPREKMLFVELTQQLSSAVSRQIWVPGLPWALYSENADSRSVLVYHSGEGKSRRASGPTTVTTK